VLYHENKAKKKGFKFIVGVDEVGRGPLAGPVVASAVMLTSYRFKNRIDDSKKLSSLQREKAFREIIQKSFFGLGIVSESAIDEINILEATRLAMQKALLELFAKLEKSHKIAKNKFKKSVCALIDGCSLVLDVPCQIKNIIDGDSKSLSIACASIVAKVTRDKMMTLLDKIHPEYEFSQHKGYGTKRHIQALKKHGPSVFHRKSFAPIKCLEKI
jgi:ribonuclease HII